MYLKNAQIERIKCFERLNLEFQSAERTGDPQSNWNVIIGENGDGKTTLLQAIAAGLVDAPTAQHLLDMNNLVRKLDDERQSFAERNTARISVTLQIQEQDRQNGSRNGDKSAITVEYLIAGEGTTLGLSEQQPFASTTILEPSPVYKKNFVLYDKKANDLAFLKQHVWKKENIGWFSCGYGPFRRAYGASLDMTKEKDQLQQRYLTLFNEGAAVHGGMNWLKDLERKKLKAGNVDSREEKAFQEVKEAIERALPEVDELVFEEEVYCKWRGSKVTLDQLSDGYRSMFVMITDILRWIEKSAPPDVAFTRACGVLLIDEIDAHLHPRWQREIGFKLTEIFPNMQFIVTSHSPFIAMAAGERSLTVLRKEEQHVIADQSITNPCGWAVSRVLNDIFGILNLHDPRTEKDLERYDDLYVKRSRNELNAQENEELDALEKRLNKLMGNAPSSPENKRLQEDLAYFSKALREKRRDA